MLPANQVTLLPALHDIPEAVWLILAKIFGAAIGSAISIVYVLPRGKREASARFFIGLGVGVIFGSATGHALAEYLGVSEQLSGIEITLSGSAASSLCAWWGLGIMSRLASRGLDLRK